MFEPVIGRDVCKRINILLSKYNLPRYPGVSPPVPEEVVEDIRFIEDIIYEIIPRIMKWKES